MDHGRNRLYPRITESDWLVLRGMRPAIEKLAARTSKTGDVAIDLGCGTRPYISIFDSLGVSYRGADFTGGDIVIDESGLVEADDSSADLVLSFQVLEHVRDVSQYLGEARRILRDNGWLILSTHGTWLYHPHPGDYRRWTRQGLVEDLAVNGFETVECIPVLGPLAWTTALRLTGAYKLCQQIPWAGSLLAKTLAIAMNIRGYLEDRITPHWITRENACVYVTLSRLASSGRP